MPDKDGQQKILTAIDRLLAGEKFDIDTGDAERDELLAAAKELKASASEPSPDFVRKMDSLMERLQAESPLPAMKEGSPRDNRRWFPGWLTWPRTAAAMTALIIGLGTIGLTTAIIRGYGPAGTPGSSAISEEARSPGTDELSDQKAENETMESARGTAPSAGDATAPGFSAETSVGISTVPSIQRVIQTADYDIEVARGEFQEKFDSISSLASKYGGYVESANTRKPDEDSPTSGRITIKIANTGDNFTRAQEDLDELGKVISKNISGHDVTEEYVDLQSRLRNAEAQEAQLLALMQRAQTIDEILAVQSRLDEVQAQIEQIKGRINYMDSRIDFATLNISLSEDGQSPDDSDGATEWGFVDAIRHAGWLAVQTVNFVIISLGVIVPLTALALLVIIVAFRIRRRRSA